MRNATSRRSRPERLHRMRDVQGEACLVGDAGEQAELPLRERLGGGARRCSRSARTGRTTGATASGSSRRPGPGRRCRARGRTASRARARVACRRTRRRSRAGRSARRRPRARTASIANVPGRPCSSHSHVRGEPSICSGQLDDPPSQIAGGRAGEPARELEQRAGHLGALLLGLEQHGLLQRDRGAVGEAFEQAQPLLGEVGEVAARRAHADPAADAEAGVERRDRRRTDDGRCLRPSRRPRSSSAST